MYCQEIRFVDLFNKNRSHQNLCFTKRLLFQYEILDSSIYSFKRFMLECIFKIYFLKFSYDKMTIAFEMYPLLKRFLKIYKPFSRSHYKNSREKHSRRYNNPRFSNTIPDNHQFTVEDQLVDCSVRVMLHFLVVGQAGYKHVTFGTPAIQNFI